MSSSPAEPPILRRICLRVRDPQRSMEFYRAVLGLELAHDLTCISDTTDTPRSLDARRDFGVVFSEGLPPGDHLTGLDRVSFEVSSRESVDRVYAEATKHNARATQPRLYEGHWQTFVFDPDGYKVEVYTCCQDGPPQCRRESRSGDHGGRSSPGDAAV
jgi:catechol 2,3-dioxygenase-like lactoylglutathione lyase family enzyme